jgi:hypothetical protein
LISLLGVFRLLLKGCSLFSSCQREMPNSQWGDTGSGCAVGRRHP